MEDAAFIQVVLQLLTAGIEGPQFVFFLLPVLVFGPFEELAVPLVIERLVLFVPLPSIQEVVNLLLPGPDLSKLPAEGSALLIDGENPVFEVLRGDDAVLLQIEEKPGRLLQLVCPSRIGPGTTVPIFQIRSDKVGNGGLRFLRDFSLEFINPLCQGFQAGFDLLHHSVDTPNPSVLFTLLSADALPLHCPNGGSLVDRGNLVGPLPFIGQTADAGVQSVRGKMGIVDLRPGIAPLFQRFGTAPICRGNRIEGILADPVQPIRPSLLGTPLPVGIDGPNGTEEMDVGVRCASFLGFGEVNGVVGNHRLRHKILQDELPCDGKVFLHGEFILKGEVKAVGKLGLGMLLHLLNGIPEGLPVCVLPGTWGGKRTSLNTRPFFLV